MLGSVTRSLASAQRVTAPAPPYLMARLKHDLEVVCRLAVYRGLERTAGAELARLDVAVREALVTADQPLADRALREIHALTAHLVQAEAGVATTSDGLQEQGPSSAPRRGKREGTAG